MAKKKKHHPHEEEGGEAWLLPYSDLMTLLLAVFIVLFAVSQVDVAKAKDMSDSFSEELMTQSYVISKLGEQEPISKESPSEEVSEQQKLEAIKAELDAKLQKENLAVSVTTSIDERGLVISFSNAIIFGPGSAEIIKENESALLEIADLIHIMDNYIRIEGHTDNIPMSSALYPSNWELSSARAVNVVRLFVNQAKAMPEKLIAVGYGEYRPIADNSTEEGRMKNRRIDIIVLSEKYSELEK
ncbi:MAG: OmpA family protein [Eubacteriales bacterium]|nr:OmpA family protein [Eubacteriales bacterium]